MFFYKCGNQGYFVRQMGEQIVRFEKWLCGCFCLGTMLFFLAGPFLMFSNLSVIAKENLVTGASMEFGMNVYDSTQNNYYDFEMFKTTNVLSKDIISEDQFNLKRFNVFPETKFFENESVQRVRMEASSETQWDISPTNKDLFIKLLRNATQNNGINITLKFDYTFTRPVSCHTNKMCRSLF
jgi:hypothetical protein